MKIFRLSYPLLVSVLLILPATADAAFNGPAGAPRSGTMANGQPIPACSRGRPTTAAGIGLAQRLAQKGSEILKLSEAPGLGTTMISKLVDRKAKE